MFSTALASPLLAAAAPAVTLFPKTSNVYGRAQPTRDNGVARYLGILNTTTECQDACLAYSGADGTLCHSFSFHHIDFPDSNFAGHCYAVADHSWEPHFDSEGIDSGRVSWPMKPCGEGSADGCEWMVDPDCLADGEDVYPQVSMTVSEAERLCASMDECVGFGYHGAKNTTEAVDVVFKGKVDIVHGGGSGCWSHRKYYPLTRDPYRTAFHFQPSSSWMNDPNGCMLHKGLYHLFWQWNPSAVVGFADMHWGHAVSKDLLHWTELPIALYPDTGSCGGEWSGSATVDAPQGVVLSYSVQCNNYYGQAEPVNRSDPLLVNWTANHVVGHKAPGTGGFRDPSSAWLGADGVWRQLLACSGAACLYNSSDFETWSFAGHAAGPAQGATWEMPDLFPLGNGLEFLKVGMSDGTDYWTTGTFDESRDVFLVNANVDELGNKTQIMDFGMFYSSKSFADPHASSYTMIGWVGEEGGPMREWSGIQSIPRTVSLDPENIGRVLFRPIPEVDGLRGESTTLDQAVLDPGTSTPIDISGLQLDLVAEFQGPFVVADEFGIGVFAKAGKESSLNATIRVCADGWGELSLGAHSGMFLLPQHGALTLRLLVDRSIVEAFAADGRGVVTARAYPGLGADQVRLLNRGSGPVSLSFTGYPMRAAKPSTEEALRLEVEAPRVLV